MGGVAMLQDHLLTCPADAGTLKKKSREKEGRMTFRRLRANEKLLGEDREKYISEVKRRYENGVSLKKLAWQTGRSSKTLKVWLEDAGVTLRTRQEDNAINLAKAWAVRAEKVADQKETIKPEIISRYRSGYSIRAIAEAVGRSYGFVNRIISDSDTPMRPQGGARIRSARKGKGKPST
jgi:hypothetical protein